MNSKNLLLFRVTLAILGLLVAFAAWTIISSIAHDGMQKVVDGLARTRLSNVGILVGVLTVFRLGLFPYLKSQPIHLRFTEYKAGKMANEMIDALVYAGVFVFMVIRPFAIQAFLIPSGSMWPTLGVNDFIVANKAIYRYTEPKVDDIVVFHPPDQAAHLDQKDKEGHITVDFVKRLIGTPGETIELRNGVLYRNGQVDKNDEKYAHYSVYDTPTNPSGEPTEFHSMTPDQVKMMPKSSFKFVKYKGNLIPLQYSDIDANAPDPANHAYGVTQVPEYQISDPAVQKELMAQAPQPIPPGMYFFMGDNRNGSEDGRFWGLVPRDSIIGRSEFIWLPLAHMGTTR